MDRSHLLRGTTALLELGVLRDGELYGYSRGDLSGERALTGTEVCLRHQAQQLGRLVMGPRRGHATYTERDRDALQRCADSVGEALALAERRGYRLAPKSD
jgi:hypothetical protein